MFMKVYFKMTEETALKRAIKDYLNLKQIAWWYNLQGLGSYRGIPDFCIHHRGKLYALEAKSKRGRQSQHQQNFQQMIERTGGTYILCDDIDQIIDLFP